MFFRYFIKIKHIHSSAKPYIRTIRRNYLTGKASQKNFPFQKRNFAWKANSPSHRAKVRELYKCDEKQPQKKELKFRYVGKTECEYCNPNPLKDNPPLKSPPRLYDPNKMIYPFSVCPDDTCNIDPPRLDNVLNNHKTGKKVLPILKPGNCGPCAKFLRDGPPIKKPPQLYDPNKMIYPFTVCPDDTCNIDPPRLDNVLNNHKTEKKALPILKPGKCEPCGKFLRDCPPIKKPPQRYDPNKMIYPFTVCPDDTCNIDPPRLDNVLKNHKTGKKALPILKPGKCEPCAKFLRDCPPIKKPPQRYDPNKMIYPFTVCPDGTCNIDPPRLDNVLNNHKTEKKALPILKPGECEPCAKFLRDCPPIKKPPQRYDPNKMIYPFTVCPDDTCDIDPPRLDNVLNNQKTGKKVLPILKPGKCEPCGKFLRDCPPIKKPPQRYDPNKMIYPFTVCPDGTCNIDPPRLDNVLNNHKTEKKALPILKPGKCEPCGKFLRDCPPIEKPPQRYDPNKMIYPFTVCPDDTCNIDPPRLDNVLNNHKTEKKALPILDPGKCEPCAKFLRDCPPIKKPPQRYDPNKMIYPFTVCPDDTCDIDPPRLDNVLNNHKTGKKVLPVLKPGKCEPCGKFLRDCPPIKKPPQRYDPNKMIYPFTVCPDDTCDLDPPRLDDVLCYKPSVKELPPFNYDPKSDE